MSCTTHCKYSGRCWARRGSVSSPSYTINYPLSAKFRKCCWLPTSQRHRM